MSVNKNCKIIYMLGKRCDTYVLMVCGNFEAFVLTFELNVYKNVSSEDDVL